MLPAEEALAVARGLDGIDDAFWRASALADVGQRLPKEQVDGVVHEAVNAAREVGGVGRSAKALSVVAGRLPSKEALIVARSIDDAYVRASTLAEVAERLPAEEKAYCARGGSKSRPAYR
jgi:hypothetical protein